MNNLLPKTALYIIEKFSAEEQSEIYYVKLLNEINWQHDVLKFLVKKITTKRKVAF